MKLRIINLSCGSIVLRVNPLVLLISKLEHRGRISCCCGWGSPFIILYSPFPRLFTCCFFVVSSSFQRNCLMLPTVWWDPWSPWRLRSSSVMHRQFSSLMWSISTGIITMCDVFVQFSSPHVKVSTCDVYVQFSSLHVMYMHSLHTMAQL